MAEIELRDEDSELAIGDFLALSRARTAPSSERRRSVAGNWRNRDWRILRAERSEDSTIVRAKTKRGW